MKPISWKGVAFTARKQSLGQGNLFTPVCQSVHGGGGLCIPACNGPDTPPGKHPSGRHPLGRHSLGRHHPRQTPILGRNPLCRHPLGQTSPQADTLLPPSDNMAYGQPAGGTHPTGMHTCGVCFCVFTVKDLWWGPIFYLDFIAKSAILNYNSIVNVVHLCYSVIGAEHRCSENVVGIFLFLFVKLSS